MRLSSESNRASASVLASSVLPTPVGPRKIKDPVGLRGSLMPARARSTAFATSDTASSCPTTRRCKISSSRKSFSRSPSIRRVTGIPAHLETISAISSSVTSSLNKRWETSLPSAFFSSALSFFSSSGNFPYRSSATFSRLPWRSRVSISSLVFSICSRNKRSFWIACFSFSH